MKLVQAHATRSTGEVSLALRFIGIDPESSGGNCPAVWVDDATHEIVIQGWQADEATKKRTQQDSPLLDTEGVIRVPGRMAEILRKALDDLAGS
ncbi:hypothetical protein STXM2123_4396 [Streptomyces sp. F-3]|uniref:hypothetical protein n=1 Tax=Streptomyces TaxID=1883 RepID=UPI0007C36C29|nr:MULTISPECIES: hypothetical protein [Streptomyces]MDN5382925.1 hypothetical protein [Streptomyces sp. LB8]GAT83695.1 hypothetical protein STXM2123_4396 [Streptomyces sp. F-3]